MKNLQPTEADGAPPATPALRILAVDDDRTEFPLLEDGFEQCGQPVELTTATTGPMAMATVLMAEQDERPQLALVDVNMPLVSGFELAGHLIEQGVPTILMSSHVDPTRAAKARTVGALDLLVKPGDAAGYAAFAARILRMLQRPH